jgi:YidC/Oxa1 family membrane protein insertase
MRSIAYDAQMYSFFISYIYIPLYSLLVWIIGFVPGGDVGVALVIITLIIRFILLPLSIKTSRAQKVLRELQPKLDEIKKKYTDQREMAEKTMALYREYNVNPFSAILIPLIQIPLILGLYVVFANGGLPTITPEYLYAFIPIPAVVSMHFLGFIDMASKSIPLAVLAGITQFMYAKVMPQPQTQQEPSFASDFAKGMQLQMTYVLPFIIGFVAYSISAAVALYLVVGNVFSFFSELYTRHRMK